MTLQEILSRCNPDDRIKVGMKSGSGFIFIGELQQFLDGHEAFQAAYIARMTNFLNNEKNKLEKFRQMDLHPEEKETDAQFAARKISHEARIENLVIKIKKDEADIDAAWIPYMDREVKDGYTSTNVKSVEPLKHTIIIIDGKEHGKFWTSDEVDNESGFGF